MSRSNLLLTALLILWAVFLFGGFIFGKEWKERTRRMPVWTRMASSFTLVIFAWAAWLVMLIRNDTSTSQHPLMLPFAIGMTLGFLGDLFMAKLIPVKEYVLGGMTAFGLGHIAYIIGILQLGSAPQLPLPHWGALIFWWVVAVALWYVLVYRGAAKVTVLHYAALPYALLLASTTGLATGLALQSAGFIPLAFGAFLFLISDLILATRLFNNAFFWLIDDVVWLTYGPGQMLIVAGAFSVIPALMPFGGMGLF